MGMGGQHQAPAALPLGKRPVPIEVTTLSPSFLRFSSSKCLVGKPGTKSQTQYIGTRWYECGTTEGNVENA